MKRSVNFHQVFLVRQKNFFLRNFLRSRRERFIGENSTLHQKLSTIDRFSDRRSDVESKRTTVSRKIFLCRIKIKLFSFLFRNEDSSPTFLPFFSVNNSFYNCFVDSKTTISFSSICSMSSWAL